MSGWSARLVRILLAVLGFGFLLSLDFHSAHGRVAIQQAKPAAVDVDRTAMRSRSAPGGAEATPSRVTERMGDWCTREDVAVYQGATSPLPSGIPTYTVEILNVCVSGCAVGDIHVRCGWFSSARLINPRVFRRVGFDDCLVNDGAALRPGQSLSFQYANTYQYPLDVASVSCS